jgi:hypothetical protein
MINKTSNVDNRNVTRDVENYLLNVFSENPDQPFTNRELISMVKRKFSSVYGNDLDGNVVWALDAMHFNKLTKRVAPGTWESIVGPDAIFTERETGYAPAGEFIRRGYDTKNITHPKNKGEFKSEIDKADLSIKMLKNMGKSEDEIKSMLQSGETPFNPVAVKLSLKKHFHGSEI